MTHNKPVTIPLIPTHTLWFPPCENATEDGLLAAGGDLSARRLLLAYSSGIFPWYGPGEPLLWWCPHPRFVLRPEQLHIPRSLHRTLRKHTFHFTFDTAFEQVIQSCATAKRPQQTETWITPEMLHAYTTLFHLGYAHSVEAWQQQCLVGGCYGIALGAAFFGESMFFTRPNASKAAFVHLVKHLHQWGYQLIDCQQQTSHLERFGAQAMDRPHFLQTLRTCQQQQVSTKAWKNQP